MWINLIIINRAIGICCPDTITERNSQLVVDLPATGRDHVEPWEIQDEEMSQDGPNTEDDPEERGCGLATKQFPKISGGRPADPGGKSTLIDLTSFNISFEIN